MNAAKIGSLTPFKDLCNSPEDLPRVAAAIEQILLASFKIDVERGARPAVVDDRELRRRFLICEKWFRVLRGDMGYGLEHTLDTLAQALRCELLGLAFAPGPATASWAVPGSERAMEIDPNERFHV